MGSDHRFVRAKVRINKRLERMRMIRKHKTRAIDIEMLSSKQEQFQLEVHNRFTPLKDLVEEQPMDQLYDQVTSAFMEETQKLAKRQKKVITTIDKEKEEILKLNEKRKELKPFRQMTVSNQIEYTELNKTICKKRCERKRKAQNKDGSRGIGQQ